MIGRIAVVLLALTTFAPRAFAATFFGPTTTTNKLLIPAGYAAIISTVVSGTNGLGDPTGLFHADASGTNNLGDLNDLSFKEAEDLNPNPGLSANPLLFLGTVAIAGPRELQLGGSGVVSYQLITTTNLTTVFLKGNTTNWVVSVPAGKRIVIYPTVGERLPLRIERGSSEVLAFRINRIMQFDGPTTVTFDTADFSDLDVALASYILSDGGVANLNGSYLQVQPGTHLFQIEESSDLIGWKTISVIKKGSAESTFYRIGIAGGN